MSERRAIWCCGCGRKTDARLTTGSEVYAHRPGLATLPFWKCDQCGNFVGCHHKTEDRTKPLGCIPTPEIKAARQHIHRILDPIWKKGHASRGKVYAMLSERMKCKSYHTAEIRSVEEAREVYRHVAAIARELDTEVVE